MQTGAPQYKYLEDVIFVGSQRYILNGSILGLEFKVSQVVQETVKR